MSRIDFTLILTLTEILKGSKVDSNLIEESLKLLCTDTIFDGGLIYELDYFERFNLREQFSLYHNKYIESFLASEYRVKDQGNRDDVIYIVRNEENTELQIKLLDTYNAKSLIVACLMNEDTKVSGLVIFVNSDTDTSIEEEEMKILNALLLIVVRYVGLRSYHNRIVQTQTSLESILDNTGIDIYVNDFNTHDILYVNKSMAKPYGGREMFMGQKCWKVLFPGQTGPCEFCPQNNLVDETGNPTKVYTWDYQRAFDGEWFRVFSAAFPWVDGRLAHVVSSANITDNKQNEAMIEYLANYDQLTNLPNRRMLLNECEERIIHATASENGFILFFDIDGFKAINDTFGHDAGDEMLMQLSAFLSKIPMVKNAIFRNGGDEFVAVIGGEGIFKENIESLGYFIHQRFEKPWVLKKGSVFCNTSIGVACFPEDGRTTEVLLQKADEAMYYVKKSGGGRLCFSCDVIYK